MGNKVFELTIKRISISYSENYEKARYSLVLYMSIRLVKLNKPIHLFDLDVFIALLIEYRRHCNQSKAYVSSHITNVRAQTQKMNLNFRRSIFLFYFVIDNRIFTFLETFMEYNIYCRMFSSREKKKFQTS